MRVLCNDVMMYIKGARHCGCRFGGVLRGRYTQHGTTGFRNFSTDQLGASESRLDPAVSKWPVSALVCLSVCLNSV